MNKQDRNSTGHKLAMLAGALTTIAPASGIAADVVVVDDRPISMEIRYNADMAGWDVDGNGSDEFVLFNWPALGFSTSTNGGYFIPLHVNLRNNGNGSVLGVSPDLSRYSDSVRQVFSHCAETKTDNCSQFPLVLVQPADACLPHMADETNLQFV